MVPLVLALTLSLALAVSSGAEAIDLVDMARREPGILLDIRYATSDNFAHKQLYPIARCLLRSAVADQIVAAQNWLDHHAPGSRLLLKDCYRPTSIQRQMWELLRGTRLAGYVAAPDTSEHKDCGGSVHNYGAAVDAVLSKDGHEIDMGTAYDYFGKLAAPRDEERFLSEGKLTVAHVAARHVLRDAMVRGGHFYPIPNEWWHFDAHRGARLCTLYSQLDVPLTIEIP